jgi:hypothetical protein
MSSELGEHLNAGTRLRTERAAPLVVLSTVAFLSTDWASNLARSRPPATCYAPGADPSYSVAREITAQLTMRDCGRRLLFKFQCHFVYGLLDTNTVQLLLHGGRVGLEWWLEQHY